MITSPTKQVPLDQLTLSDQNVRTNDTDFADLKASIFSHGLINPLVVTKHKDGYRVVAGGRRLRALEQLTGEDRLPPDHAIPVRIVTQENAEELSLVENFMRADLKPYEIYQAFALVRSKQADVGVEELADRFAMKVCDAQRILRLGNLLPEIMAIYAAGEMTDNQAQAFAASADPVAQAAALATWHNTQQYARHPSQIRTWLGMGDRDAERDLEFVGREAYEQAGGTMEQDLFSDAVRVIDTELLASLVAAKKQAKADEIAALSGAEVTLIAAPPATKSGQVDYGRQVAVEYGKLSEEDEVRLMEIAAACEKLEDEDDESNEDELRRYNEEWEALEDKRPMVLPEKVQVTIDTRGTVRYWKPEETEGEVEVVKPEPEEKVAAAASGTAITEMGKMRREFLRQHVIEDTEVSLRGMEYLTFVLARQAYGGNKIPGVEWVSQIGVPEWAADDWMQERDLDKAWVLFNSKDQRENAMDMVAMMVVPTVARNNGGLIEWLGARVEPVRWISTPEFWGMFRKGQIFDMLDEVIPAFRKMYSNGKQDEIRAKAHAICAGTFDNKMVGLPIKEMAAASTWVPSWLRLTVEEASDGAE